MEFKKEDWKIVAFGIIAITIIALAILAPKPYWLDGGGMILQ